MTKIWECSWNPGMILGILPYHWPLIQAANTYGMITTSISNITMVSDTIHMMWMGRTIHHHAVTTTHDGPIWGVAWNPWLLLENKPHHCAVVEPPDPPGMLYFDHIQGIQQHSYDVDGQNNPLPWHYHHSCWHRLGELVEFLRHCWASYHTIVQWLRL